MDAWSGPIGQQVSHHHHRLNFGLTRSPADRVVAGVAAGLGRRLGVDPLVIRAAFVVLAFAGGAGIVLYLLGWLVIPEAPPEARPAEAPATRPQSATRQVLSVGLVVSGMLVLLRTAGIWFGDAVVWPVGLAAFGSAVIWTRSDQSGRAQLSRLTSRLSRRPVETLVGGRVSKPRIVVGGLLVLSGMTAILVANNSLAALGRIGFAVVVTATGLGVILGPWIWRLGHELAEERRERIRSEERAEVAAHLHDSVLQTLALIQRADTPQQMASLARGQERDLRSWLYGSSRAGPNGWKRLSAALEEAAGRVERLHGVPVEVVTVGDCPLDDTLRALVDAVGEAMSNAARHSGAAMVSVYVEVAPDAVTVFVRDGGSGFEAEAVQDDRRGIAESIVGRMERHGGAASVVSERDRGTEWSLRMPRKIP